MFELEVNLGKRSYPIVISSGLLDQIGVQLNNKKMANKFVVIADSTVAEIHGNRLLQSLSAAGIQARMITFPAGEGSKNLSQIEHLARQLAQTGIDRKDALIAFGGGVTGDITGFLAAIYMRGIHFIQIPTTLLAQVDSSVGGKTGVDILEGKNLIGAFYQPRGVYIDIDILKTLPMEEFQNGLAEVIKYSIIYDKLFFDFLKKNTKAILDCNITVLAEMINRCCAIKAEVVGTDEKEGGLRRILNFGHTIGHAVEACSNYNLPHGVAVAMGMGAACSLAVKKGLLPEEEDQVIRQLITDFGLPLRIPPDYSFATIKDFLKRDKKTIAGRTFFVLPTTIGKVMITDDVADHFIEAAVKEAQNSRP